LVRAWLIATAMSRSRSSKETAMRPSLAVGLTDSVFGYHVRAAALEPLKDLLMSECVSGDLVVMGRDDHEADGPPREELIGTLDQHGLEALDVHHQQTDPMQTGLPHQRCEVVLNNLDRLTRAFGRKGDRLPW